MFTTFSRDAIEGGGIKKWNETAAVVAANIYSDDKTANLQIGEKQKRRTYLRDKNIIS